jgi:two-component system sensor histidine kinase QseC
MRTLRARLLVGAVIGTGVILAAAAVALYAVVRDELWTRFDESLESKVRSLAALVEQDVDGLEMEFHEASFPEFATGPEAEYFQLWRADGGLLQKSPSLGHANLEFPEHVTEAPQFQPLALPDGRTGRAVRIAFLPRLELPKNAAVEPIRMIGVVARDTLDIDSALNQLAIVLAGGCVVCVVASVGVMAWFVRSGLSPLDRLAGEISTIDVEDLSRRIVSSAEAEELAPIVARLNELLARLEAAFAREKSFTADVAHELRTPLAGLRTTLEVALMRDRGESGYRKVIEESQAMTCRMQHLVENLLELARADAGQLQIATDRVDLPAMAKECWSTFAGRAASRALHVDWRVPEAHAIRTDAAKARLVLGNVFDNATRYADEGGTIAVELQPVNGQFQLKVTNSGSHVAQSDAERVFDRFWRNDASRAVADDGAGFGVGLPICRTLMSLMGGTIAASSTEGGDFTIAMTFPAN